MRFALWQNTKWRLIDDASDGHNMAYSASERIHTTSAAAAAALTIKFRELLGCGLRKGAEIRARRSAEICHHYSLSPSP